MALSRGSEEKNQSIIEAPSIDKPTGEYEKGAEVWPKRREKGKRKAASEKNYSYRMLPPEILET